MPLTAKGEEIKSALTKEYGAEKGEQVLYAGKNKGTFTGIDCDKINRIADGVSNLAQRFDARIDATRRGPPLPGAKVNEAYKGYLIRESPFSGAFYISKGGSHIGEVKSLAEAKTTIEKLV